MSYKFSKIIVTIFLLYIGGILLFSILLPDYEFSEKENRYLQPFPEFSSSGIQSGRTMKEMENYISDHLIFRDQWVSLKASCEKLMGKQENDGIYFGLDGTLLKKTNVENTDKWMENAEYINSLKRNVSIPVCFGLIPTASEIWKEKLPKGALTAEENQWIKKFYESLEVETLDFSEELEKHKSEPIFYKTDHHWTSLGAYYGANVILEKAGMEKVDLEDYESKVVAEDFYGTLYSESGAWWIEPDQIRIYVPDADKTVISNFTGNEETGKLYNYEKLTGKNKYAFFLGGNQPLCIVKSEGNTNQRLLLIRDSYADALVPFLSERFEEIHLFDLRYNRLSIQKYVEENKIDQIVVLYSFGNYIEDENQFLLAY